MIRAGAVIIGRNEAHNLQRCLASVVGHVSDVVFVDSGSTDDSVALAHSFGIDVVELDRLAPFTVARARNAGLEHLLRRDPSLELVQFVDGDSEMIASWFEAGRAALLSDPATGVVFGRWRERQPRASVYARVYQIDGDPRLAIDGVCPGMCMMRVRAFRQAGGFNPTMQALEDHELGLRLRRHGWRIARLDAEMAVHQVGINDWTSWWRRGVRSGNAIAHAVMLHGSAAERFGVRAALSNLFWGVTLPAIIVVGVAIFGAAGLLPLAAYPVFIGNIYRRMRRLEFAPRDAAAYALITCGAKFSQALGHLQFRAQGSGYRGQGGAEPRTPNPEPRN